MSIWNGKYVSVQNVISKAYRDLGYSDQINLNDAVEWAGEAIELIGSPGTLKEKVTTIEIKSYKAKLPLDLHQIQTTHGKSGTVNADCLDDEQGFVAMRYSTDAMHHFYCANSKDRFCSSTFTYKVNDDYLFTNYEEGAIRMSYWAIPTDEVGFPLIPDQIKFREAVAGHIKWKLGFQLMMRGAINQQAYQILERDRDWYIGAAQTAGQMPGIDMLESLKNNFIRLIPKINQHADAFRSAGDPEVRYTHNSTSSTIGESSDGKDTSDTLIHYKDSANTEGDAWNT